MMVTADYGEILSMYSKVTKQHLELSCVWAELQKATVGRTTELLDVGMMDAGLECLMEPFEEILSRPELL